MVPKKISYTKVSFYRITKCFNLYEEKINLPYKGCNGLSLARGPLNAFSHTKVKQF